MPKEHSGGTPTLALESFEEESYPVAIQQFDYDNLDSTADLILEAIKQNRPLEPIIEQIQCAAVSDASVRIIAGLLPMVINAKPGKARLTAQAILFSVGAECGMTEQQIADKYKISRQAFNQMTKRLCEQLNVRQTRFMRDSKASEEFKLTHFRRKNHQYDPTQNQ